MQRWQYKSIGILIATLLAASPFTVAAQNPTPALSAEITAAKPIVRLGDPILVSVRVTNQTSAPAKAALSATAFDCFDVTNPDGERLPYIGFDGQIAGIQTNIPPASAVTIADALDLTDKYLFQKPGHYSIRFNGQWTGLSNSPAIAIEISPGQLSEFDSLIAALLPICPPGWRIAKDARGEVTPFGRTPAPGFALHLCRNHMRGEDVMLWFTKQETKVDPHQPSPARLDYLGRAHDLFVYQSIGENTPALWPTASG